MRKTRINPKLVAATLAMMTIINTAAPTIAYAAEGDTEVKVEQQIEKSESHTHEISGLDNEAPVNVTPNPDIQKEQKNDNKPQDQKEQKNEVNPQDQNGADDDNFSLFTGSDKEFAEKGQKKPGDEFYMPTEDEIKAAKLGTMPVKKPWMTDLEWDRIKQGISAAGDPTGRSLLKIMRGDYASSEDASEALALATLQGINNGIIKNIPWIGGLLHGMLAEALSGNQQEHDQMKDVIGEIKNVTTELEGLRKDITADTIQNALRVKIADTSKSLRKMKTIYSHHNAQFLDIMEKAANGEEMSVADLEELAYIYSTDHSNVAKNKAYEEETYLETYLDLADTMLNTEGVRDQNDYGGMDNIFGWTDKAWSFGKNCKAEIYEQRRDFVNSMEDVFNRGYSVLSTAITIEGRQLNQTMLMCQEQIKKYNAMLEKTQDQNEINEINAKIKEYQTTYGRARNRLIQVNTDYTDLTAKKKEIFLMLYNQKLKIINNQKDFDAVQPERTITYKNNDFDSLEVVLKNENNKGETVSKNISVYPSVNEKDQIMEYKDRFGYVYATQDLSMKKITANELEVGGRYVVKGHFSDAFTAETREIFVVGFRTEKTVWTKMFGWAGATKRIRSLDCKYIDPETGLLKWCRICLDNGDVIEARVKSGPIQMKNGADLATKLDYECMI